MLPAISIQEEHAVLELAGQLAGEGIEKVTLEATSDYWRIWFYLLESAGLDVQLVNARGVCQISGVRALPVSFFVRSGSPVSSRTL